jgi:hypothetical protein
VINCTTPAVAAAGDATPNGSVFEVTPSELSETEIVAVPGFATSEAGTVAERSLASPNVVVSGVLFQRTCDAAVNPEPAARSVNVGVPATT